MSICLDHIFTFVKIGQYTFLRYNYYSSGVDNAVLADRAFRYKGQLLVPVIYLCLVVLLPLYIVMHCNEMSCEQIKIYRRFSPIMQRSWRSLRSLGAFVCTACSRSITYYCVLHVSAWSPWRGDALMYCTPYRN